MSLSSKNNDLVFSVQGQPPQTIKDIQSALLIACGGIINSAFLKLLDTEISEVIYYIYLYIDVQNKINPPDNKVDKWGVAGAFD